MRAVWTKIMKWGLYETKPISEGCLNLNHESEGYKNQNWKVRARKFWRYHWIEDLPNSWAWVHLRCTQAFFSTVSLYEQRFSRYGRTGVRAVRAGVRAIRTKIEKWGLKQPKSWRWGLYETKLKSEGYKNQNRKVRAVWTKIMKWGLFETKPKSEGCLNQNHEVRAIWNKTDKWGLFEPKSWKWGL